MFIYLLAEQAMCFSDYSTLEGDSQQLTITAVLIPNDAAGEDDVFCQSSSGKEAEILIRFATAVNGMTEFKQKFVYQYGVSNNVEVDLSIYDFTTAAFMSLISVPTAAYEVYMQKLETYSGTFRYIMHTKQDVSGCWRVINFRFGILPGEEYFSFTLTPNMCQIPEDVKETIYLVAMTTIRGEPLNLRFLDSNVTGGFSYPYEHYQVVAPIQYCADYDTDDEKNNCLLFIGVVESDTDWQIKAALIYDYMDIHTEIIGSISGVYEMFDSEFCATQSNLQVDLRHDRVMVSHLAFGAVQACNSEMAATKTITWVMQVIGTKSVHLRGYYNADEYYRTRDFVYMLENADLFAPGVLVYFQSIYRDENGAVVGGLTIFKTAVLNCITQVSLRFGSDYVKIEQRMHIVDVCTYHGIENKTWRLFLLNPNFEVYYYILGVPQQIDHTTYINKFTVTCDTTGDVQACKNGFKKIRALGSNGNALVEMTADIRQFGNLVYSDDNTGFFLFVAGLMFVYLVVGTSMVLAHIIKQHRKE